MSLNLARLKQFEVYGLISYTGFYSGSKSYQEGRLVVMQKTPSTWNLALWFNFKKKPAIQYDLKPTRLLKVDFKLERPAEKRIIIIRLKNGTNLYFKTLKNGSEKDERSVQYFVKLLKFLQNYRHLNTTCSSSVSDSVISDNEPIASDASSIDTTSLISQIATDSHVVSDDNHSKVNTLSLLTADTVGKKILRTSENTSLIKKVSFICNSSTQGDSDKDITLNLGNGKNKAVKSSNAKTEIKNVGLTGITATSITEDFSALSDLESEDETAEKKRVTAEVQNKGKSGLEIYLENLKEKARLKGISNIQTVSLLNKTVSSKPSSNENQISNTSVKEEFVQTVPNLEVPESTTSSSVTSVSTLSNSETFQKEIDYLSTNSEEPTEVASAPVTFKYNVQASVKRKLGNPEYLSPIKKHKNKVEYLVTNEKVKENINPDLKSTNRSNLTSLKEKFKKVVVERFSGVTTRRSKSKIQVQNPTLKDQNKWLRKRSPGSPDQTIWPSSTASVIDTNDILFSPKKQLIKYPEPIPSTPVQRKIGSNETENLNRISPLHKMPLQEVDLFSPNSVLQPKSKDSDANQRKIIGFPNLGNTCYMSCVFQSLFALKLFTKDLLNSSAIFEDSQSLTESVLSLLQIHYQGENLSRYGLCKLLGSVKKAIEEKTESFKGGRMEDAHELLVKLLVKLKEEAEIVGITQNHGFVNPVVEHFEFQFCESYTCVQCKHLIQKFPNYYNLSLDLYNSEKDCDVNSIAEALELYFKPETLDYNCEKCASKQHRLVKKLYSIPNILIIQLKRYKFIDNNPVKNTTPVSVPQSFCLKPYCNDSLSTAINSNKYTRNLRAGNSVFMYKLVTSIHHDGSIESGHYYNEIYDTRKTMCIEISDELVTQINVTKHSETGYIFFYCNQNK